jgi:hypothetical protein
MTLAFGPMVCKRVMALAQYGRGRTIGSIRLGPIDAPAPASRGYPDQLLHGSAFRIVVEHGGTLVEAPRVPGIAKWELMEVEMVAKLVTESAQERSERRDVLSNGGSHPNSNDFCTRVIITKQLGRGMFSNAQGSSSQHADRAGRHLIKIRGARNEFLASPANVSRRACLHRRFHSCGNAGQFSIGRQQERVESIASDKEFQVLLPRRSIRQHRH